MQRRAPAHEEQRMMQTVLQHPAQRRNTNRAGHTAHPLPWGGGGGPPRGRKRGSVPPDRGSGSLLLLRPGNQVPGCLPRPATAPNREQWPPSSARILPTHQNTGPCSPNSPDFQGQSERQVGDTLDCCLFLSQNDLATDPRRLHNSRKS